MAIALVAMLGLNSCSNEQNFIDVDHSADLVGTWTCLEADHAAAYIFNADGTVATTGIDGEAYWEDEKGTYSVVNNKITMEFESGRIINGSFDIIPGQAISIVGEKGRHTYQYCKEDLADEVVGMWVCNNVTWMDADMAINVYQADGKALFTGFVGDVADGYAANVETKYKVIGDLMFQSNPMSYEGAPQYIVFRLNYSPNGTELGDVLTNTTLMAFGDEVIELTASMLRIKQYLELPGMKYDYIKTFISNVKGEDKDIEFFNTTFNFAKFDNSILDKFLKSTLFSVHFPDANTIEYSFLLGGQLTSMQAPIAVDGNKMTIKMSELNAVYRDVDVYTFQDQDNTQMHIYMPTSTFENFLGNMQLNIMAAKGQADLADAAAVKAVFDTIENAIETINVSLVMTKATK